MLSLVASLSRCLSLFLSRPSFLLTLPSYSRVALRFRSLSLVTSVSLVLPPSLSLLLSFVSLSLPPSLSPLSPHSSLVTRVASLSLSLIVRTERGGEREATRDVRVDGVAEMDVKWSDGTVVDVTSFRRNSPNGSLSTPFGPWFIRAFIITIPSSPLVVHAIRVEFRGGERRIRPTLGQPSRAAKVIWWQKHATNGVRNQLLSTRPLPPLPYLRALGRK